MNVAIFVSSLARENDPRQFTELPLVGSDDVVEFFPESGEDTTSDIWFKVQYKNGRLDSIIMMPKDELVYEAPTPAGE